MAVPNLKTILINTANVLLATVTREDGNGTGDVECIAQVDARTGVSASISPPGTPGTNGACVHRVDGSEIAGDGVDGVGIVPLAGGSGIRGWLSTIASLLGGTLKVQGQAGTALIGGVQLVDSAGAHKLAVDANGRVGINNFPATQPISGSVSITGTVASNATLQNGIGKNSASTGLFVPMSETTVPVDLAAGASMNIAGVAGKKILITAAMLMANGTGTIQFKDTTAATNLSGQMAVTPETGFTAGSGFGAVIVVPAGDTLQLVASGAAVAGWLTYTIAA